jgi:hypothetical protein
MLDNMINIVDNTEKVIGDIKIKSSYILLFKICLLIILIAFIYTMYKYLYVHKGYSAEQLATAMRLNTGDFTLAEFERINLEIKSLNAYNEYFGSVPYSLESQGINELAKGVVLLPIVAFVSIYVLPPLIISYIIWFIIKYSTIVIEAVWGGFLMAYHYSTKLMECKVAEKWYIRLVTGWHKCHVDFSKYFDAYVKEYITVPLYYNKMDHISNYYHHKEKYITPYINKYYETPKNTITSAYNSIFNSIKSIITIIYNFIDTNLSHFYKFILEFDTHTKPKIIAIIIFLIISILSLIAYYKFKY